MRLARVFLTLVACLTPVVAVALTQQVVMPLERYEDLRARAAPSPTPTPVPAVAATIERVRLDLEIGEGSARLAQLLEVNVLAEGWQSIAIPSVGTFMSADFGGLEGRVSSSSQLTLTVRGPGRHTVRLESLLGLERQETSTRPVASLDLALPQAAAIDGVVTSGDWVEEVEIGSNGLLRGRTPEGGWLFSGKGGAVVRLRALGRAVAPKRDTLPLRFDVASGTITRLSRSRSRMTTWLQVKVLQGELEELRAPIPEGMEVIDAEGVLLAGWDLEGRELVLTTLDPLRDAFDLRLELGGASAAEIETPLLVPRGAVRSIAAAALTVDGDGLLELEDEGSGRLPSAADRRLLPPDLLESAPFVFVVDDLASRPRWRLTWSETSEVLAAQVDRLRVELVAGEADLAVYRAWAWVRSSGASTFELAMPAGFTLVAAGREGVSLRPGLSSAGLVMPLTSSDATELLFLEGLVPITVPAGTGRLSVVLPRLSAPAARIDAVLGLPAGRSYELVDQSRAGRVGWTPEVEVIAKTDNQALVDWLALGPVGEGGQLHEQGSERPTNFKVVEASWSALSAAPEALQLKVKGERIAREWF